MGAGSAGLILALSLQQNDVPFRIIEKQSLPRNGSRGSGIMVSPTAALPICAFVAKLIFICVRSIFVQPRSQELYEFLGIMDELRPIGRPTPQMRLYKLPGGTEILRTWDMVEKLESTPMEPYVSI